ncbi:O-antigen polymerase [Metapseudomonas sp. CR1201]
MKSVDLWIPSAAPFFLFGVVYYLVSPAIALGLLAENRVISAAIEYIGEDYFGWAYFIDILLIVLSFFSGYFLFKRGRKARAESIVDFSASFKLSPILLFFLLSMLLMFFVYRAMAVGAVFFSGYANYDILVLGPFATLIFLSALFHNYFKSRIAKISFFLVFLASSFFMLSLGSRMFFVLGSMTIALGLLSRNKGALKSPLLYLGCGAFLCLVVSVGVWRSGGNISLEALLTVFFAEPIFTAASGAAYMNNLGERPVLGAPLDVLASLVNFIPSFVYPEKVLIIEKLIYDENKFSPFGASSIIVNVYSNFGMLYPLYFLCVGGLVGGLNRRAHFSVFYRSIYLSILPLLMFHFFRENFMTVLKVSLFNGFILPFLIVIFIYIFFGTPRSEALTK